MHSFVEEIQPLFRKDPTSADQACDTTSCKSTTGEPSDLDLVTVRVIVVVADEAVGSSNIRRHAGAPSALSNCIDSASGFCISPNAVLIIHNLLKVI